jgi:hypothetical protein
VLLRANASSQTATIFDHNLVVNGNAEAGKGAPDASSTARPIPNWTATGNFTPARYGGSGGLPAKTDPGPPNRGKNFFSGGPSNPSSSAEQTIDVTAGSSQIDAGGVTFRLSAYLGGYSGQEDNAVVRATFIDGHHRRLGAASVGPVTAGDRSNITRLLQRGATGTIPAKTRSIDVRIVATRYSGSYNDGYSDDISLILKK